MLVVRRLLCTADTCFHAVLEKHFVVRKLRKQWRLGKTPSIVLNQDLLSSHFGSSFSLGEETAQGKGIGVHF